MYHVSAQGVDERMINVDYYDYNEPFYEGRSFYIQLSPMRLTTIN